MGGLALVDFAVQIEVIVGADGDIDFLFGIAVEVSEIECVRAVLILLPSVERGAHILPAGVLDLSPACG